MSRFFALVLCLLAPLAVQAQFLTPATGVILDMDDLVSLSGGAVTGGSGLYVVHDLIVIQMTDTVTIAPGDHLSFTGTEGEVGFDVNGSLLAIGTEESPITLTGQEAVPGCWLGIDFISPDEGAELHLVHTEIGYANIAVDAFGTDFTVESCEIHHCLEKALDFSGASGLVEDCHIHHNQQRTITMTLSSSPTIRGCILEHNNQENDSPYPYINVGLQGVNSPLIENCTITGNGNQMSGGMAFWAQCEAQVLNNSISGCGYGILCYSTDANPLIRGNEIFDNTIHPDTVNWGFGVACNGNNAPTLADNHIHGHWYGVAAINGGQPNLGNHDNTDPDDDGGNFFHDNGIGGRMYAFFNNTNLPQMAHGNDWGTFHPAEAIWDQEDDPSLGLVDWDHALYPVPVPDTPAAGTLANLKAYPNPFNPMVQIKLEMTRPTATRVVVLNAAGRVVRRLHNGLLPGGETVLQWNGQDSQGRAAASGVYWLMAETEEGHRAIKASLVR